MFNAYYYVTNNDKDYVGLKKLKLIYRKSIIWTKKPRKKKQKWEHSYFESGMQH
jgi:hypothetical protein